MEPFDILRIVDMELRRLVVEAHNRSATFRRLAEDIRGTRRLVFVQAGRCPERATVACLLHFVGTYNEARYLRVLVTPSGRHPDSVIATLAHELQHVWEVAQDSSVTNAGAMLELSRRIGNVSVLSEGVTTYETRVARQIETRVLLELAHGRAAARN